MNFVVIGNGIYCGDCCLFFLVYDIELYRFFVVYCFFLLWSVKCICSKVLWVYCNVVFFVVILCIFFCGIENSVDGNKGKEFG